MAQANSGDESLKLSAFGIAHPCKGCKDGPPRVHAAFQKGRGLSG